MMTEGMRPLSQDDIASLLTPAKAPVERSIAGWFTLDQVWSDDGCENPNCEDPRPQDDTGRNVVAKVNGHMVCRYCFLNGVWQ